MRPISELVTSWLAKSWLFVIKEINLRDERNFCARFGVGNVRPDDEPAGTSSPDTVSDPDRESRTGYCPVGAEFRQRSFHSIVDRPETRCRHSAESALRRGCGRGASYVDRACFAEYGITPADFDAAHRESRSGLYFHRDVGFGSSRSCTKQLLHADHTSRRRAAIAVGQLANW